MSAQRTVDDSQETTPLEKAMPLLAQLAETAPQLRYSIEVIARLVHEGQAEVEKWKAEAAKRIRQAAAARGALRFYDLLPGEGQADTPADWEWVASEMARVIREASRERKDRKDET